MAEEEEPLAKETGELQSPILLAGKKSLTSKSVAKKANISSCDFVLQEGAGCQCRKGTAGRLEGGGCPWERELGVERQVRSPEPHLHPDTDPDISLTLNLVSTLDLN